MSESAISTTPPIEATSSREFPMVRLFLLAFLFLEIAHARADERPPNRLISEGIPAWRKLRAAEEHGKFTLRERKWATENGRLIDHWSRSSKKTLMRDGASLLVTSGSDGVASTAYLGANPRYLFKISRSTETAPYVLRGLDFPASEKARADLQRQMTIFYSIARSRLLASIPLEEIVTDPGFLLKKIEAVGVEGHECLTIHFAGALARHKQTFLDSWMILDPARDWSIQRSEASFARSKLIVENEYWPESRDVSWLRRCQMTTTYPAEHIVENYEYLFDQVDQGVIPASTFLLSSFGMPEPDQPVAANYQSKLHYWLIGGAVAMFAAAYGLRRRSFRAV